MYDNDQLYLRPEVARALGYNVPNQVPPPPRVCIRRPMYLTQNRRTEQMGFIPAVLMLLGAGFVILLLIVGALAALGHIAEERMAASSEPPRVTTQSIQHPDLPRQIVETRSTANAVEIPAPDVPSVSPQDAVSVPVQTPQEPQQAIQVPAAPEVPPDAGTVEGPLYIEETSQGPLSWQWVCGTPQSGNFRCSLRDQNGNYVQTYGFEGNGLAPSNSVAGALQPRAWGCERTVDEKLYCTIQDGRGTILQGCIYDGKNLGCGTEPGNSATISTEAEQASAEPEYLPSAYDIGCLNGLPFGSILVYEHIPRWAVYGNTDRIPEGTCLLVERANINGYRRVVSLDGKYAGYAQIWPQAGNRQTPKPMQPGYTELIARLRRIP